MAIVVDLVRRGVATTRPEIEVASGLGRKVVTQRVQQAIDLGLFLPGNLAPSAGGRQPRTLRFNSQAGVVLSVFISNTELTIGVADLEGRLLEDVRDDWDVGTGPEKTLAHVRTLAHSLLTRLDAPSLWAVGVGVPGPVDFDSGRLVAPPIMPGWDGFSVRDWLQHHYGVPVWVDNDTNLMALAEWTWSVDARSRDMLFINVETGIGAGAIVRGHVLRGQNGAAGDIGHTHVSDDPAAVCRCGRTGCLEAIAGGWSLLEEAEARVHESAFLSEAFRREGQLSLGIVGEAAARGDRIAQELIEPRARALAGVVANVVNFCNPKTVVLGGGILRTGPRALAVLTDVVTFRCTDLALRDLVIRSASLNHKEGVLGGALLAVENLLALTALPLWVETGHPQAEGLELQRLSPAY